MSYQGDYVWVDGTGGEIITTDAMEAIINRDRWRLVGRTAGTIVLRNPREDGEQTFTRTRGDLVWI